MKAILEFDLDNRDDRNEHLRAIAATDAFIVLYKIDDMLRDIVKYDDLIQPGAEFALPLGPHTITESESVLLNELASVIRSRISHIIVDGNINMGYLE